MKHKVLDSKWRNPPINSLFLGVGMTGRDICIGIVAISSGPDGEWKCYIGYGAGLDEDADAQRIAANGMPLASAAGAVGLFPSLDIERYRY